jgi:hypothetical protein
MKKQLPNKIDVELIDAFTNLSKKRGLSRNAMLEKVLTDACLKSTELFVLYKNEGAKKMYWNGSEFKTSKKNIPYFSCDKAEEYAKLFNCSFTDAE